MNYGLGALLCDLGLEYTQLSCGAHENPSPPLLSEATRHAISADSVRPWPPHWEGKAVFLFIHSRIKLRHFLTRSYSSLALLSISRMSIGLFLLQPFVLLGLFLSWETCCDLWASCSTTLQQERRNGFHNFYLAWTFCKKQERKTFSKHINMFCSAWMKI